MTPTPHAKAAARRATVYGEPITELLPALAAICSGAQLVAAGADSPNGQDMLSLSLTLEPSAGGSLRRAMLRSQAEILRRQADVIGSDAPAVVCQHCSESAAMCAVAERLQRVARELGVTGTTLAERALLLGQLTSTTSCRCRGVG